MKIKVGDIVKFLNDTGSGEVTRIIDQKTALVQIDGGFEVPCMIKDLVKQSGSYDGEEDEVIEVPKKELKSEAENITATESDDEPQSDDELLLAFVPGQDTANFEVFLINSSSYHFKYSIARQSEGEVILFHESTLEAGLKISLGNYHPSNVTDEDIFKIQGVFFNEAIYKPIPTLDKAIRVEAKALFSGEKLEESDYFHEKALLFTLKSWKKPVKKEVAEEEMAIDPEKLKEAMFEKSDTQAAEKKKKNPVLEVDLHIASLMENSTNLTNSEMLDIQLSRFRTALETAILHRTPRVVFIHGVGNGKLKHEIRKTLEREYRSTVRYQDASFKEYGYGATMVILK